MPGCRVCARQRWVVGVMILELLGLAAVARGEDWPRFRGPNGQGIAATAALPAKWSESDYNWKVELPGGGHSSPVVWGDKVFVTCADDTALRGRLLCLNAADGRELWRKEFSLTRLTMNSLNSYASATPALDAEHVYMFWPDKEQPTLVALTHEGGEVWATKLPGIFARHGAGSSPIVHGQHVIVSREHDQKSSGPASVWLALDRKTGQMRWRYEHPENANGSYSTPCVWREQLIFTSNSHGVAGVNPETGALLWKTPTALPARVVSSPVLADDMIVATCGEGGRGIRLAVVKPPAGDAAAATEVYGLDTRIVPYVPVSIARDGLLFAFHDQGTVSCLRVVTGEMVWSEKPAGRYFGSPIWADGKLYGITVDGAVVVLRAGPKYELLAINLLGEKSHATPAVANGRMYLRTYSQLASIGGKKE